MKKNLADRAADVVMSEIAAAVSGTKLAICLALVAVCLSVTALIISLT